MNDKLTCLNNKSFKKIISNKLVLIDFWAEWCNPCKMLELTLLEILNKFKNKLIIAKLNVGKYSDIATLYNVQSVPTLLLFKNSKLIDTKIGNQSKYELEKFINNYIK